MKELSKAVTTYVAQRRALGFKMIEARPSLADFREVCRRERAYHITVDLAVRWAKLSTRRPAGQMGARLRIVRQFAEISEHNDSKTEFTARPDARQRPAQATVPVRRWGDPATLQEAWRCAHPTRLRAGRMRRCWGC